MQETAIPWSARTELPGVLLGTSNVLIRARGPAPRIEPDLDANPRRREEVWESCRRAMEGPELFIEDAIVHGVRIRLTTNSFHVADFWKENWHNPLDWRARTGFEPPSPDASIFLFDHVENVAEQILWSRRRREVFVFNNNHYGQVRSAALWLAGGVSELGGIVPGTLRVCGGRGTFQAGADLGSVPRGSSHVYHGTVLLRPACPLRPSGRRVTPVASGDLHGEALRNALGGLDPAARVRVLALDGESLEVRAEDLDTGRMGFFAYPGERACLLRADAVLQFPWVLGAWLEARFVNVPNEPAGAEEGKAEAVIDRALASGHLSRIREFPRRALRQAVLRLLSAPDAWAMVPQTALFGESALLVGREGVAIEGMPSGDRAEEGRRLKELARRECDPFPYRDSIA